MNLKIKLLLLSFFCAVIVPLNAQTTQKVSLQQAIELGIKNSNNLKIAEIGRAHV